MPERRKIAVSTIKPGQYFDAPVYLDDKYILLSPESPLSEELKKLLQKWEYKAVFTDGAEVDSPSSSAIDDAGDDLVATATIDDAVKDQETWSKVRHIYSDLSDFTEKLFAHFVAKEELPQTRISDKIKETIENLRNYRGHMLRLSEIRGTERNYIVMHTVKSTVLCLAVGQNMKLPPHRLLELGTAALLHEIGMVRLPQKLYLSDQPLNPQERKAITAHPVLGFKILRSLSFPMPVCLAVLESHERIDGKGYPRGLPGEKISMHARIITACDSYSAQVSRRPYREARDGHASILELLKERGTAYDDQVLRIIIQLMSVYPVGTYVELQSGSKGLVVETNPEDARQPFVRVIMSPEGKRYMDPPTVRTSAENYRIQRALQPKEIEAIKHLEKASSTHQAG